MYKSHLLINRQHRKLNYNTKSIKRKFKSNDSSIISYVSGLLLLCRKWPISKQLLRLFTEVIEFCVGFESEKASWTYMCIGLAGLVWSKITPWPFSLFCGSDQVEWPQRNFTVANNIYSSGRSKVLSDNCSEIKWEKNVFQPAPGGAKFTMHCSSIDRDEPVIRSLYPVSKSTQLLSQIAFFLGGHDI